MCKKNKKNITAYEFNILYTVFDNIIEMIYPCEYCCGTRFMSFMCWSGLVTLNDMKAKQEALVKEREKQLAKKEQSKELQLWVFVLTGSHSVVHSVVLVAQLFGLNHFSLARCEDQQFLGGASRTFRPLILLMAFSFLVILPLILHSAYRQCMKTHLHLQFCAYK